jgi:Flp pilus assembly secretin CpaC
MKTQTLAALLVFMTIASASADLQNGPTAAAPGNTERAPVHLGVGEQRLLRIEGLQRYSLGSDGIVRVLHLPPAKAGLPPSNEALLLKGISPGTTDLWAWKSDGSTEFRKVRVEATPPPTHKSESLLPQRLEAALDGLRETEVILAASGVILRGETTLPSEANLIGTLKRGFPNELHDETILAPALKTQLSQRIDDWLKEAGNRQKLLLSWDGGRPVLSGSIEDARVRAALEREATSRFPMLEFRIDSLPDAAPTVHFRVFLLELKKSRFGSLGLGWPALQEGAFRVTRWGIEEALQLDLLLQSLEGEGSVRILSNPELSVRAPGEAELFAGGEIPIESRGKFGSNITFRPYGLSLKLHVTHASGERVRLDISTEVSHIDESIGAGDTPGFQANRMKTQVDARFTEPLLLSGLLQQGVRETAKGLPLLRQIPILGALFGSEDYLRERSELVAILLPLAKPPHAPMEKVVRHAPRGPLPPPRNWLSPRQELDLRAAPEFPWNAF